MRVAILLVVLSACGGPPTCPVAVPADGSACGDRGLACESGGGAHQRCSTIFTCDDALDPNNPTHTTWTVTPPAASCTPQNDSSCAVTYASTMTATACPTPGLACDYAEGRCECVPCNPTGIQWRCRPWNDLKLGTGCPSERPALGTKCETNGTNCRYDDNCRVSFGPDFVCFDGIWTPRLGAPRTCGAPVCGFIDG